MSDINSAVLLLGSNIEPRSEYINNAVHYIRKDIGEIVVKSSIYETDPIGIISEVNFLNQVILVRTPATPQKLLVGLMSVERHLGRERNGTGYESRTIDIDILYYNNMLVNDDNLRIPHPRLHQRSFVLVPLCELFPEMVHPEFHKTNRQLLDELNDTSGVKVYE